jgi:Bacterial type II and III secretion system protein
MSWLKTLGQIAGLWLLLIGGSAAQERHLYNYTLRHALPEQVLPALSAQITAASSITPYRQQLILNVTADEYRTLTELLKQLDTAPRSLLISVRNRDDSSSQREQYGLDGRIGDGAVPVQTGRGGQLRTQTNVVINRSTGSGNSAGTQQVRAVEGMAAFISAGQIYPVRSDRYGSRELVPVTSGFYATVRVLDDEVIVDIDQHDDRLQNYDSRPNNDRALDRITTQRAQTQVRGRLGSWIPLGGVQSSSENSDRSVANYGDNSAANSTELAIKVDLAQ